MLQSRAVVKVVDETIASIEADNRKLLTRAVTAEHIVKVLKEQNSTLQLKIDHCDQHHHRRPRTVSSQPTLRRQRVQQSPATPLAAFNDSIDERSMPGNSPLRAAPLPPQQPSPTRTARVSYRSPPSTPPTRPLPSPTRRTSPRTPPTKAPPRPPRYRLSPIDTSRSPTSDLSSPCQDISSPIPGSVTKHRVTYQGTPVSFTPQAPIISLAEAQTRMKPLPPVSPRALHGNVQIGLGIDGNDLEKSMSKRKRGFSALFRKGRKASA
jgi:hypothetical protein